MMHVPNVLSGVRAALAAPFAWALHQGRVSLAVVLLGVAAALDLADGAVARRWGWETPLGATLDAWADALVLLPAATVLAHRETLSAFVPVVGALVFARFMVCGRGPASKDPFGRYLGTTLYALLLCALLWPGAAGLASWLFVLQAAASLLTHVSAAGPTAAPAVGKIP